VFNTGAPRRAEKQVGEKADVQRRKPLLSPALQAQDVGLRRPWNGLDAPPQLSPNSPRAARLTFCSANRLLLIFVSLKSLVVQK
jgi:hypothetical protein